MYDPLAKMSLLYVEDERNLAEQMRCLLQNRVRHFAHAADGEEGLRLFKEARPDLVVTDITMPRLDGLTLSRKIHDRSPETPIVVLSAYSDKEKLLGAIDVGIVKYFIKPFDPEDLLETLHQLARRLAKGRNVHIHPQYRYNRLERILFRELTPLALSHRELDFLEALIDAPEHLLDTASIKALLWPGEEVTDDAVRVFLNRLRRKTGKELIRNRSGEGYYLVLEP